VLKSRIPELWNPDRIKRPRLIVVIDTEEDFDWSQAFSRTQTAVQSLRHIGRVQQIFDAYRITPVYVIDYPVTSQTDGFLPLREIYRSGRCLIGAHLHPWVNPPFEEEVNRHNSFPGNLAHELELTKLRILSDCIEERFGDRPVIYKAGRYGLGPHTLAILEQQGFEVDLSVCPRMDYSHEGGPDYTDRSAWPHWAGPHRTILGLPLTVGYAGLLRRWGSRLHNIASGPALQRLRAVGALARLGLVNKIWLSPEGYNTTEHIALVRALYADGLRIFSFAFHSPSVEPGNTPYVRSRRDLEEFLSRCRRFFDFFLGDLGGEPTTPLDLKQQLYESVSTEDTEGS
jgi:hypothetical protein